MLYVGSILRTERLFELCIVDEDTDEYRYMSYTELRDLCESGTPVLGVSLNMGMTGTNFMRIHPHQHPKWAKRIQAKTAVVHEVNVTTYKNTVTAVTFDSRNVKHDVTLRLSDYGDRCACDLLSNVACFGSYGRGKKVTIVLDDKINFQKHSFIPPISMDCDVLKDIVIDLREVTSDFRANRLYWMFGLERCECLLDNEERRERFQNRELKWYEWVPWFIKNAFKVRRQ